MKNRIVISVTDEQLSLLHKMMNEDHQQNKSSYFVYLMSQEDKARNKRPAGRPKKSEDDETEDIPDENAPRVLTVPLHLAPWVPYLDKGKLVNEFDILVLEEKKKMNPTWGDPAKAV